MRIVTFGLMLSLVVLLAACGGMQKRTDAMRVTLDSMVGKATKENLVNQFGLPEKKIRLDEQKEILEWHPRKISGVTKQTNWNYTVSEVLRVTFTNGVVSSYMYSPYEILQ